MKILDILLPYQRNWLMEAQNHKRTLTMWSRQTGKSAVTSFEAVYKAILERQMFLCISTGERASGEYLKKVINWAKYMEGMLRGTPLHFTYEATSTEVRFSNGSRIVCLPSNPSTCRGYNASLIIDEFAAIENAEELYTALMPSITSPFNGDKTIRIMSTPIGKGNLFWKMWTQDNDFYKSKLTIYDAVKQGLKVDIEELRKSSVDEEMFAQEFLCDPLDSNSSLFSYDLLARCKWQIIPDGEYCLGIDIGRKNDLTAIAILIKSKGRHYIKEVLVLHNVEYDEQFGKISSIIDSLHPKKVSIDATGIGNNLAENLKKKYGGMIDPVMFTNQSKNELFNNAKQHFGSDTFFLPEEPTLIDEFHSIRRVVSPSGGISFSAPRENGSHADRATACVLALRASTRGGNNAFLPIAV